MPESFNGPPPSFREKLGNLFKKKEKQPVPTETKPTEPVKEEPEKRSDKPRSTEDILAEAERDFEKFLEEQAEARRRLDEFDKREIKRQQEIINTLEKASDRQDALTKMAEEALKSHYHNTVGPGSKESK